MPGYIYYSLYFGTPNSDFGEKLCHQQSSPNTFFRPLIQKIEPIERWVPSSNSVESLQNLREYMEVVGDFYNHFNGLVA